MAEIVLDVSDKKSKKFMVYVNGKTVHFGDKKYMDFTQHKDPARQKRYIQRHKKTENWTASGIDTPGFWSRWLLWEYPSIDDAIHNIQEKFGVIIESNI